MTNNPAIHRRPSGDIDIAVPHDPSETSVDVLGTRPFDGPPAQAGSAAGGAALPVPEAA